VSAHCTAYGCCRVVFRSGVLYNQSNTLTHAPAGSEITEVQAAFYGPVRPTGFLKGAYKMTEEQGVGCARPTGGPVGQPESEGEHDNQQIPREGQKMIQVGKAAPDFVAPAYHKGKFTNFKLSDHMGKWIVLCFYPGDFTFV
jgi:peroxiredoxin (alkyl hydroperoxide reductase subunit C)